MARSRDRILLLDRGIAARALESEVVRCRRCPRLVDHREGVAPRASFAGQRYWMKPVPGFGDINGRLLIIGIAPAAHGGNRTGRVFTGDSSGRFLVRALHSAGFASQSTSEFRGDGLVYDDCFVTAAVKCAPPGDRPTSEEFVNCSPYLDEEIRLMRNLKSVLVLGALSFKAYVGHVRRLGYATSISKFEHGHRYRLSGGPLLYASYHPSPRNTYTGLLSHKMLVSVLRRIRADFNRSSNGLKA